MFNINPTDMTELGFRQYFNEFGSVGNIKEKIQPPKKAKLILMACGHVDASTYDVGIVVPASQLFDQRAYPSKTNTEAKSVNDKDFFVYYSTTHLEPIGFSAEKEIKLYAQDIYDGSASLEPSKLDGHRVSAFSKYN